MQAHSRLIVVLLMYNVKAYQLVDCEETSCGYHEDTTGDGINAD